MEELVGVELIKLKAVVAITNSKRDCLREVMLAAFEAFNANPSHGFVSLQLVSNTFDPRTMKPKLSKEATLPLKPNGNIMAHGGNRRTINHDVEFAVESNFGIPGALLVTNKGDKELFLENINIEGIADFVCNSWVRPDKVNNEKRIFFCNKVYLPNETPEGLKELREEELRQLRGDGEGVRLMSDRIYDYDVYNDIGDPDKGLDLVRPTLGGEENPHPRRCRTGRPAANTDERAESRVEDHDKTPIYVPRDETLADSKREAVNRDKLKGILRNIVPSLVARLSTESDVLKGFSDVNGLYRERSLVQPESQKNRIIEKLPIARVLCKIQGLAEEIVKFEPPKIISGDNGCCLRDDDFGRQVLAGINTLSIECLREFPPKSKLDPSIYPLQSALKEEHIIGHLDGMSLQKLKKLKSFNAIEEKKLFILDYHDIYLPFLNQINALEGRKAYATRAIFFLTSAGTLKPIAIELSLPPSGGNIPSNRVLSPPVDATSNWLWQMGKAHVCSNDAGVHQLVHHWLRTHACMEPFIIAAHRQMSRMHPIFKLLEPHMRYTLKINAMARETLINAGGIIETDFTPGHYCMLMSCAAYRDWWRFDFEGLPSDLIRRGMAVADESKPHGVKLVIEDYPYASDGLLIWSAIERLVQTYVNYYYPNSSTIWSDTELQACPELRAVPLWGICPKPSTTNAAALA
ncbi:hypothetical protein CDL15_Pgr016852 [Punica granatum]|uniref:Lipoxygenase n=1 Tax=Punica granatum TaxID=22663 RepID=A0A218WX74_PUNGR|nr:hypothetical protein CDL15_Pgr016852 [Punica granatum]